MADDIMEEILENEEDLEAVSDTKPDELETKEDEKSDEDEETKEEEFELDDEGKLKLDEEGNKIPKKEEKKSDEDEDEDEPFIKDFNETLGTGYKNKEEIKGLKDDIKNLSTYKEASEKVGDYDAIKEENQRLKADNVELKELYDPEKIFVSKTEYNRQQLLRKYPDYDPSVITKIVNSDLSKMTPQQAIVLHVLLKDGDIYRNDTEVYDMFEEEHGINLSEDLESLESVKRNKVLKVAKDAKILFAEFHKEPEKKEGLDIMAQKDQDKKDKEEGFRKLKESWELFTVDIHKLVPDIAVKVKEDESENEYVYKLDEEFRRDLSKKATDLSEIYAKNGYDLTDESKQRVIAELKRIYIDKNFDKIVSSFIADGIAKYVENQDLKKANPKRKTETASKKKTDAQKEHEQFEAEVNKQLDG